MWSICSHLLLCRWCFDWWMNIWKCVKSKAQKEKEKTRLIKPSKSAFSFSQVNKLTSDSCYFSVAVRSRKSGCISFWDWSFECFNLLKTPKSKLKRSSIFLTLLLSPSKKYSIISVTSHRYKPIKLTFQSVANTRYTQVFSLEFTWDQSKFHQSDNTAIKMNANVYCLNEKVINLIT